MQDRIETIIRDYFVKEYGNGDALPKPVLSGLADVINEHRWEIHSMVQEEYDMEDIEDVASANEYELTKEEKETALYRYKKLEDSNLDLLYSIVDEVVKTRKEK